MRWSNRKTKRQNIYDKIYSTSDLIKMAKIEIETLKREYDSASNEIEKINEFILSHKNISEYQAEIDRLRIIRKKFYNQRVSILCRIKRNQGCITNYNANCTQKTE